MRSSVFYGNVDVKTMFAEYDKDGDGQLDLSELESMVGEIQNKQKTIQNFKLITAVLSVFVILLCAATFAASFAANELSKDLKISNGNLKGMNGDFVSVGQSDGNIHIHDLFEYDFEIVMDRMEQRSGLRYPFMAGSNLSNVETIIVSQPSNTLVKLDYYLSKENPKKIRKVIEHWNGFVIEWTADTKRYATFSNEETDTALMQWWPTYDKREWEAQMSECANKKPKRCRPTFPVNDSCSIRCLDGLSNIIPSDLHALYDKLSMKSEYSWENKVWSVDSDSLHKLYAQMWSDASTDQEFEDSFFKLWPWHFTRFNVEY